MTVYVNNTAVRIFSGATARDAVLRYCADTGTPFTDSLLYDSFGKVIAADSPMNEGRRMYPSPSL